MEELRAAIAELLRLRDSGASQAEIDKQKTVVNELTKKILPK